MKKRSKVGTKLLATFITMILVVGLMPMNAFATYEGEQNEFAGGNGTLEDPYLIETKEQLDNVRNHLGSCFELVSDITFVETDFLESGEFYNSGDGWIPIGNSSQSAFSGNFDGNNHSISGLYMNIEANSESSFGLFGYISGDIADLNIESSNYQLLFRGSEDDWGSVYIGGLVGYQEAGEINNCITSISIQVNSQGDYFYPSTGGITGYSAANAIVKNCQNKGVISVSSISTSNTGGICGNTKSSSQITNCVNDGAVSGGKYTGGIVGNTYEAVIGNCRNAGKVESDYNAGGIVGYIYSGNVSGCYNVGEISSASNVTANSTLAYSYAGGIVGDSSRCTISDCYNAGSIISTAARSLTTSTPYSSAGGIAGKTSGTIQQCYNVGSIKSDDYSAGICGYIDSMNGGSIVESYYINVCSQGVFGITDTVVSCSKNQMIDASTYGGFDFVNVWKMGEDSSYLFPELIENRHSASGSVLEDTTNFGGGDGTMLNPYKISTKEHLNNVRNFSTDGNWFEVTSDISFSSADFKSGGVFYNDGKGWIPIGNDEDSAFIGVLEGNGHTVSGLESNIVSESTIYVGLFGYCQGSIQNLKISNVSISGTITGNVGTAYVGGLCGYLSAGKVEDCSVLGNVKGRDACVSNTDKATVCVGGIVGEASYASISNCNNYAVVYACAESCAPASGGSWGTYSYAGGIAGKTRGVIENSFNIGNVQAEATGNYADSTAGGITASSDKNILVCYNTGMVKANGSPNNNAGGIVGSYTGGILLNCYNSGSISSSGEVGGVIGYLREASVSCVYNIGELSKEYSYHFLGGVIGYASDSTIGNAYYVNSVSKGIGSGSGSTISCDLSDMTKRETYANFDFGDVWTMEGNASYLYPEFIHNELVGIVSTSITKEPTCTEDGIETCVCSNGVSISVKIPKLGHTIDEYEDNIFVDETMHGKKCSICEETVPTEEHSYGEWQSNETKHWKECLGCHNKKENALHSDTNSDGKCDECEYGMHTHSGTKVVQQDATCTSYGIKAYYKCSCGKYYIDADCRNEITDLDAWKNGDGKIDKKVHSGGNATCKEKAKCSSCGTEYGNLADHNYSTKWSYDGTNHWHECIVCGNKKDSAAHTLKTTITKATLTANGKKEIKCSVCSKVTKTTTIYAVKTIKLSATAYTYDGKAKKIYVTIKDSKGNVIASSNYTVTYPSGRKNVGKYTVKVTFKGDYRGSEKLSFKINPPKISISSVSAKSRAFAIKWARKTTQVDGYEIQYSTSKSFVGRKKTVKVTSNKTVFKTISKLDGGKKFYVRIRTYKMVSGIKYYSDWSAKKAVTTKK